VHRRIFGLETEYRLICAFHGSRRLSPDEAAGYLFGGATSPGGRGQVSLPNGARLYLDVGSHPEYATPECDSVMDLVAHDKGAPAVCVSACLGDPLTAHGCAPSVTVAVAEWPALL